MQKAWNKDLQIFGQSYEETHVLDSGVMIMPLVFFMNPSDPRFLSTLKAVLKSPERGGLTSNVSSFRYSVQVIHSVPVLEPCVSIRRQQDRRRRRR